VQAGQLVQQAGERYAGFGAGQHGAQAVVGSVTESQVPGPGPAGGEVKGRGSRKVGRVAVGAPIATMTIWSAGIVVGPKATGSVVNRTVAIPRGGVVAHGVELVLLGRPSAAVEGPPASMMSSGGTARRYRSSGPATCQALRQLDSSHKHEIAHAIEQMDELARTRTWETIMWRCRGRIAYQYYEDPRELCAEAYAHVVTGELRRLARLLSGDLQVTEMLWACYRRELGVG